jgi:hypothetical protein
MSYFKFCDHPFFNKTFRKNSVILCCIFSGITSYGELDVRWESPSSAVDFWNAIKPKGDLSSFNAHRQEVESTIDRLGVRGSESYFTCVILKNNSDKSAHLALPQAVSSGFRNDITPLAVKIFSKLNPWLHPFDTHPGPPSAHPLACASFPYGFLLRHYDRISEANNEEFDISSLKDGRGFTSLVFIPAKHTIRNVPLCLVIRIRVWEASSPAERFVKQINTRNRIEDVSGDGNCCLWAVLRSLKNIRDQYSNQGIGNSALVIPDSFDPLRPTRADYELMTRLRAATSEKAKKTFTEAFNGIRRHFANAFSIPTSIDEESGQERLPMTMTIPPSIELPQVKISELHELSSAISRLDDNIYRWDLFAQVNSSTGDSLRKFQLEARGNLLADTDPARYRQLMNMDSVALWLAQTDIRYLVEALGVPLLIVYPKTDNDGHFTGEYGCYFFYANGQGVSSRDLPDSGDTRRIAELLNENPHTITIYYNGTNHYQAIVREP